MYVYTYVYIYMFIHIYIYMYINTYKYLHLISEYIHVRIRVFIHFYRLPQICVHIYPHVPLDAYVVRYGHIYRCLYHLYAHRCICSCSFMCIFTCMYVCICIRLHFPFACVDVYEHSHTYITYSHMWVCMQLCSWSPTGPTYWVPRCPLGPIPTRSMCAKQGSIGGL